jgi:hypothetical protein
MNINTPYSPIAQRVRQACVVGAISGAIAISLPSMNKAAETCSDHTAALSHVNEKYRDQFKQLESDGEDLKKDAVTFDIKIDWKDVEILFDLPSVDLREQKWTVGLPQVSMNIADLIFGTPSSRMVPHKVGQYPEFYCDTSTLIPHCSMRWSDIITDVPEFFMQEQHVKTLIPEFTFADTQIILGVPEFTMVRQRMVIGLPQFTLKSVYINAQGFKDRGEELGKRAETLKAAQSRDSEQGVHQLYGCYRQLVVDQRDGAARKFDSSLSLLNAVIENLTSQGANPTSVKNTSGEIENFVAKRDSLAAEKAKALEQFTEALSKLDTAEKQTVAKMSPTQGTPSTS